VPEHVRMHWKVEVSRHTEPGDHLRNPAVVKGEPRSLVKMNGEAGSWSRLSRRSARNSRPDSG
jgi:hypothetical protein